MTGYDESPFQRAFATDSHVHVLGNPTNKGDWEVKEKGADRSVKVYEDKSAAIGRAKELAKKPELGQVVVRNADGKIQTEYTYGAEARDAASRAA